MNTYVVTAIFFVICCSKTIDCFGLREDFMWTSLSYMIPKEKIDSFESNERNQEFIEDTHLARLTEDVLNFPDNIDQPVNTEGAEKDVVVAPIYIEENNIPMGANRWKDKLFITVPRRAFGIPSTLNYVDYNETERYNVPLKPYPDYELNKFTPNSDNDESFTSVYRVAVDRCDRLWFVDTGYLDLPGNRTRIKPTTLIIIDLNTDKIIRRHVIPERNLISTSNLVYVTVDVASEDCENSYAYIPDFKGYGLIVYSFKENDSWRVSHNYFFLEPLAGEFLIGGIRFQWNDGVFSIALSNIQPDGHRIAYFHSLAGTHLFCVSTRVLKNRTLATRSFHGSDFKVLGNRNRVSQTSASDLHKKSGIMFLGLVNQNALGCWNTNKDFRSTNFAIIQKNNEKMIYPSDVKIYEDDVIVLTNTMPVALYSKLNYTKVNFRVWTGNVIEAVKGTVCEPIPNKNWY